MQGKTHIPTEDTRKQVFQLAAAGLTKARAALFMGLSEKTFSKHYSKDYEVGLDKVVSELFNVSYEVAKDKDHKDASKERQFILKTRGGFKETQVQEMTGGFAVVSDTPQESSDWLQSNAPKP